MVNKEKNVQGSINHKDDYIKRYVEKPFSREYFIEAFSRLDSLLDSLIFEILDTHFEFTKNNLLFKLFHKSALVPVRVAKVLQDEELIDSKMVKQIEEFKSCRNILVHNTDGQFEIILKESGFYKKKHVCRNCRGCIEEHLTKIGEPCLKHYSIKILRQKLDIGLSAYNSLKLILETNLKKK